MTASWKPICGYSLKDIDDTSSTDFSKAEPVKLKRSTKGGKLIMVRRDNTPKKEYKRTIGEMMGVKITESGDTPEKVLTRGATPVKAEAEARRVLTFVLASRSLMASTI